MDIVNVKFIYDNNVKILKCNSNWNMRKICEKFTLDIGIDIDSVFFLFNGEKIKREDFNKSLMQYINKYNINVLNILVFNIDSNQNQSAHIIFSINSEQINIECSMNTKLVDICKKFANKIGKNFSNLCFYYEGQKLDLEKSFIEVATQKEINRKEINVLVEKNPNFKRYDNSFFKRKNKIIIIIIIASLFVIVTLFLIIFLLKKRKPTDEIKGTELKIKKCNNRCFLCNNSTKNEEC